VKYDFDRVIDRRNSDSNKWRTYGEDILPMWVADMDFQAPPQVIAAIQQRAQHGIFGYLIRPASYYTAIIDWMRARHGWNIQREWLAHSPGVVTALDLAVHAFTQPGDKIIVQPPVYFPFFTIVRNNGRQLAFNQLCPENGYYRMDLSDLERKIDSRTKAIMLCSPHNPVGRVWTKEELTAFGELCLRKNILIFSDEIHSDLILPGHKHIPLAAIAPEIANITITLIAPSKTFNVPGLYTAAAIIPNNRLHTQFNHLLENFALNASNTFGMVAWEAAYRHGEDWLEELLDYLQGNIDYAIRFFQQRIPKIKATCPEGTYLLWLDCRELGLDHDNLRDLFLKQAQVALNEGHTFGPGGEGFMRMNIGCPRAILQEGLERIERAAKNL
jgi:cystathionine beta-lyase